MEPTDSAENSSAFRQELAENGIVFIPGHEVLKRHNVRRHFNEFARIWPDLPADPYFTGPSPTRYRRHGKLRLDADTNNLKWLPNGGYFQQVEFNPLFGGIVRHFAPIERDE